MKYNINHILFVFINFLKSKNALRIYLNFLRTNKAQNFRWKNGEHTIEELFLRDKAHNNPLNLIIDAFNWGDSYNYWRSLHRDWVGKLEQMKKKTVCCMMKITHKNVRILNRITQGW